MPGPGCPTLFKPAERNAARRGGPAGRHSVERTGCPSDETAKTIGGKGGSPPILRKMAALSTAARRGRKPVETLGTLLGHFGGALHWRITSGNCGNCGN